MMAVMVVGTLLLITVNTVMSISVAHATTYTKSQKAAQVMGIWLLPVVGALAAWVFLREDDLGPPPPENPHPDRNDFKAWY